MRSTEAVLAELLGAHDKLGARIRHVDFDIPTSGKRTHIRGTYPAFRDGIPQLDDLLEAVHQRIVSFCLPRKEIKTAHQLAIASEPAEASVIYTRLVKKASDLFIKAKKGDKRSGEAGEIILFILNEWILGAPQLVSKMYLKTSNNMPVHGTDGIHGKYDSDSNCLHLYWGESKAYSTLEGALTAALESISQFQKSNQQKREIEIVSDYIDLGDAEDNEKEAILSYLDPYSENSNSRKTYFSCLLAFTFSSIQDSSLGDDELETAFVSLFKEKATKFISALPDNLMKLGLSNTNFEFFLLPVESSEAFRDKFQALIGWPHA